MIEFFRNMFKSKVGIGVTMGFLVLIALAFASADVAGTGSFGGVAGGDRVAMVGKDRIGTADLSNAATTALNQLKQQQPTVTMQSFLAEGGLDRTLDQMIDRYAVAGFGRKAGLRAGDRLVDSEITQISAFRGADGKFSDDLFRQLIRQQGLNEKQVRNDLAQSLLARQVLVPTSFGAVVPTELVNRYASLLTETRKGAIGVLTSEAYAPATPPTDAQIAAYYAAQRDDYIRPERRVIRYATFGEEALRNMPVPTEAEIVARYKRDAAQYAASESRSFRQLVAPTEAAAKAILAEVNGGKALQAVAAEKGLATVPVAATSKTALAESSSSAVAEAAFAAARGKVSAPAKGSLGWYLMQVETVAARPGRSLADARGEITTALKVEKLRVAVADLGARIENQIDDGANLEEIARDLGLTLRASKSITADGKVYGSANETAPPVLARVISTAFAMEEGEPQLAEVDPGKHFLVFDVSEVNASAPAPLKDIRSVVIQAWRLAEGSRAARAAADRVLAKLRKGGDLATALAEEKKGLPAPDRLDLTRDKLAAMGERVPAPLALFFSMAEGTVKRLEGPNNAGWFVVRLDDIAPGKVNSNDPILARARSELASITGTEYEAQFVAAARAELGVERNKEAVAAVRRQLSGGN
jgi:peptidyl-prolyl cis-trans isomerase D